MAPEEHRRREETAARGRIGAAGGGAAPVRIVSRSCARAREWEETALRLDAAIAQLSQPVLSALAHRVLTQVSRALVVVLSVARPSSFIHHGPCQRLPECVLIRHLGAWRTILHPLLFWRNSR